MKPFLLYILSGFIIAIVFSVWFYLNKIKWWHGAIVSILQTFFTVLCIIGFTHLNKINSDLFGVAFFGGLFTLWIIPLAYALIFKLDYKNVIDTIVPLHMLILGTVRWVCYIQNLCRGEYFHGSAVPIQKIGIFVAIGLFVIFMVLKFKMHGISYPVLLMVYGVVRFIEEFFRYNALAYFKIFSLGQIFSIVSFLIGLTLLLLHIFLGKKQESSAVGRIKF